MAHTVSVSSSQKLFQSGITHKRITATATMPQRMVLSWRICYLGAHIQAAARKSTEPAAMATPCGSFTDLGLDISNSSRA